MTQPVAPKKEGRFDHEGPLRSPQVRAVRPRHAASLILVRRDSAEPRLLMGRRSGGHDFMPNKWVFPGGRVDRSDYAGPAATELQKSVAGRIALSATPSAPKGLARALALAAVRETFEEAGLILGRPTAQETTAVPQGPWRTFLETGHSPDLDALDYFARAITPAERPKRFDAKFFMADASRLASLARLDDCGELEVLDWFTLEDAAGLDLPTVTREIIREVGARLKDPERPVLHLIPRKSRFLPGLSE